MKKIIQLFTPPVLIIFFKIIYSKLKSINNISIINDYNDIELTGMVIKKNLIFKTNLDLNKTIDLAALRSVFGLCISLVGNKKKLTVLDFGGGGGYHYFLSKLIFNQEFNWNIVETKNMVSEAKKHINNNELFFYDSIEKAIDGNKKFDLFFASSSFQYCDNQNEILDQILNLEPQYLFFTKTPFSNDEEIIGESQLSKFSDNGPGPLPKGYNDFVISYPIFIMNFNSFISKLKIKYELKFQINEESNGFKIKENSFSSYGFFFVLK